MPRFVLPRMDRKSRNRSSKIFGNSLLLLLPFPFPYPFLLLLLLLLCYCCCLRLVIKYSILFENKCSDNSGFIARFQLRLILPLIFTQRSLKFPAGAGTACGPPGAATGQETQLSRPVRHAACQNKRFAKKKTEKKPRSNLNLEMGHG